MSGRNYVAEEFEALRGDLRDLRTTVSSMAEHVLFLTARVRDLESEAARPKTEYVRRENRPKR